MNAYELADYLERDGEGCNCEGTSWAECICDDALWVKDFVEYAADMLRQQADCIAELESDPLMYLRLNPNVCTLTDRIKELEKINEEMSELYEEQLDKYALKVAELEKQTEPLSEDRIGDIAIKAGMYCDGIPDGWDEAAINGFARLIEEEHGIK